MKLKDAMKIYGLDTEKEEAAGDAASSSASFAPRSVNETLNKYRTIRAGEIQHELKSWQSQYDGLINRLDNGTKSAEEIRQAWENLRPEGERLSAELRSAGLFDEETSSSVADAMDVMISSFSDAITPKREISVPKYDIGYIGPLNGEETDSAAEARKAAARALATGATGEEAEAARSVLEETDAPTFTQVGTHRIGAGDYTQTDKSLLQKASEGFDSFVNGTILKYHPAAQIENELLKGIAEDQEENKNKPKKEYSKDFAGVAQRMADFNYRVADVGDLVMDSAALGMDRAVSGIADFVKGKIAGAKSVISPSLPKAERYSVPSEENPAEDTRSVADKFVQGENDYYRSGDTFTDKMENSLAYKHAQAQREAMDLNALESVIVDLADTVGYQLPTMLLTGATGASGLAANLMTVGTFGSSAYAEQKREAMKAGYTDAQAELLARSGFLIEGIGETLLGDAFGAVPMLGRKMGLSVMSHFHNPVVRTMISFLAESAEEGGEEILQSVLSEGARSIITGEDFELSLSEVAYGGLLGALAGGAMGTVGLGQRIENAKKVHAADVDYINTLSVNAEAVSSAEEAREMIGAFEKQRAALAQVEDSAEGMNDGADRAAYMDSMIRKMEVMLSEKFDLGAEITPESGFEKTKVKFIDGLKRTVNEDVYLKEDVVERAGSDAEVADQAASETNSETDSTLPTIDVVAAEIELENAAREYAAPETPDIIALKNSGQMTGARSADISAAAELSRVFGRNIRFVSAHPEHRGYMNKETGDIFVNANSDQAAWKICAHEMTHALEMTPEYAQIKETALRQLQNRSHKTLDVLRAEKRRIYEAQEGRSLDDEYIDRELVAEYAEDLFKSTAAIEKYVRSSPHTANRFIQWLDGVRRRITQNNPVAKWIREMLGDVRVLWADAVRQVKANGSTSGENKEARHSYGDGTATGQTVRTPVVISDNSELAQRIASSNRSKYDVIREYIIENFYGYEFTLSDGKNAIIDKSDAKELSHKATTKKAAEIANIAQLIESATLEAQDLNAEHRKFDQFFYYIAQAEYHGELFDVVLNVGHGKTDGKYHIYDITHPQKNKRSAGRVHGLSGSVDNRIANASSNTSISQDDPRVNTQYTQNSENDTSDIRHSYSGEDGVDVFDESRGEESQEREEDMEITEQLQRKLEEEGKKTTREDNPYNKKAPISVDELLRSKKGVRRGFVSAADQAEAGEIEPSPTPGTAEAVGEAAAKKILGENVTPEEIAKASERLAKEAEAIKAVDAISRPSKLIYGEDEQTRTEAALQINREIYEFIENKEITPFMQSLASDIASGKKNVSHIPAGIEVGSIKTLAELYSSLNDITKQDTGHSVLQDLGIEIDVPLVSQYNNASALRGWEKARKLALKNANELCENLSAKELRAAQDIAEGVNEINDYSDESDIRKESVVLAASALRTANKFTENGLAAQRAKTVSDFERILEDVISNPQNANKRSNARLVFNTFYRNNIAVFGDDLGARINELLFRPIEANETERMRFVDSQNDEFKKNFGRVSNKESALVQSFIEAGISLEDVRDVDPKKLIERVKATLEQETAASEEAKAKKTAAVKAAKGFDKDSPEKAKAREAKSFATAARNRMTDAQKVFNAISAAMESDKNITKDDIVRITNMAEWFRTKYAIYYEAINDFLVVHGYEPIGFIKNYAPHMQEENMHKLGNIMKKLGFDDNVSELPVEIAGRTDTFKPGKKWNPHFQSRKGSKIYRLDALAGFDSYLSYMSEVLYHTDDIQKLRQFSQYLRASMSSEEVRAKIDRIRKKIRMREIDEEQGNKQIDEELGKIKNTNLSPYVTVLDNYTNIIAGKQTKGDRGIEDDFGRRYLNVGNFLRKCFVQSSIVGNFSSALAQTVQLPFVIGDCGLSNLWLAVNDVCAGQLNNVMEFDKRSDFIRGKKGTARLQNDKWYEWVINKGMIPFEFVDDFMSRVYVRAKYYQLTRQKGMDTDTALLHANRFADDVIGSRVKGAMPVIFHNKNFLQVPFTTFQIEPANAVAHITQDMPLEFRTKAKEIGTKKAFWDVWGKFFLKYMLFAFLLNWLFEELHGQTPVPFDGIGYIADGIAAGFGTTRSDLVNKILCTVLEKIEETLGVTTPFDFSKNTLEELGEEFNWFDFGDKLKDEVISDIPFVSAFLGVLGYSDSRLPVPKIETEKIKTGWSNVKSEDPEIREKGWAQLKDGIWASVKTWLPFGNQANKTLQAYNIMKQGGSYDYSGRLQYPVGDGLSNELALIFGPQAFNENNEFWAAGGQALSEKATDAYKALLDSGMKFNEAFSLAKEMSALQGDEKPEVEIDTTGMDEFEAMAALFFTDYSEEEDEDLQTKVQKQVDLLNSVEGLTDEQKYIAFEYLCADEKAAQMMAFLTGRGVDPGEAYEVISEFAVTKDTAEEPRARAEYLRRSDLTGWEKSFIYYSTLASKSERETVDALRKLNEGEPIIYETLDDLDIETTAGGDGTEERKRSIVMNSDLSDKGKYEMYSRLFVDNGESGVKEQTLMDELISSGVDAGEVATVFSGIKDGETDAEKAQVLLDSKLTLREIEKVYLEKIVTPKSREKKEEALESVIDAGGNVEVYLQAYIATANLSWENGDWKKGEKFGKAKAYKEAIDSVTKVKKIRCALYEVFDVSEQVW